jgi:hypothetical protein
MTPVRTRWARRILVVCAASALVGCDDAGGRQAVAVQTETSALRVADGPKNQIISQLEGVSSSSTISPAVVLAQQSLGQVQYAKARDLMMDVSALQQQVTRLTFEIAQRARAAQASLLLEQQIRKLDPTENVESIRALGAAARGDGNAATFDVSGDAKLPTLAAAQQKKSQLEGDVAKTQNALDTSTADRDRLLAEAGRLSAQLETQSGPERVDTVKALAEVRQKAAVAARQVSELTSQVAMMRADVDEQSAIITELQSAIESLSGQASLLTDRWKSLQEVADQQRTQARELLQGDQSSVKAGVDELKKVLEELNTKREEAQTILESSIASFGKAATTSGQLTAKLSAAASGGQGQYEKPAWDAQSDATSIDRINLDKAASQQALADLHADRARSLAAMISTAELVESLSETVNTPVPEFLNSAKLRDELTKAVTSASEQFGEIDQTLEGAALLSEKLSSFRPVRATAKIMALANHAALADLAGNYSVAKPVADQASKLRDDLKAYVDEVRSNNIALPNLPVSIVGIAPPPKPEAPAVEEGATPETSTPETSTPEGATPEGEAATANTPATPEGTPTADGTTTIIAVEGTPLTFLPPVGWTQAQGPTSYVSEDGKVFFNILLGDGTPMSVLEGLPESNPIPDAIDIALVDKSESVVSDLAAATGSGTMTVLEQAGKWRALVVQYSDGKTATFLSFGSDADMTAQAATIDRLFASIQKAEPAAETTPAEPTPPADGATPPVAP